MGIQEVNTCIWIFNDLLNNVYNPTKYIGVFFLLFTWSICKENTWAKMSSKSMQYFHSVWTSKKPNRLPNRIEMHWQGHMHFWNIPISMQPRAIWGMLNFQCCSLWNCRVKLFWFLLTYLGLLLFSEDQNGEYPTWN